MAFLTFPTALVAAATSSYQFTLSIEERGNLFDCFITIDERLNMPLGITPPPERSRRLARERAAARGILEYYTVPRLLRRTTAILDDVHSSECKEAYLPRGKWLRLPGDDEGYRIHAAAKFSTGGRELPQLLQDFLDLETRNRFGYNEVHGFYLQGCPAPMVPMMPQRP
jgi:hypothetical protein